MFGLSTCETIPEACRTEQEAWDTLISGIWREILTLTPPLTRDSIVIEVGPGISTKAARALAGLGFTGQLFVVDAAAPVIQILQERYPTILPEASVNYLPMTLSDSLASLPTRPDLLIMSHLIDDMMMYEAYRHASSQEQEAIFGWFSNESYEPAVTQVYKEAWTKLAAQSDALEKAKDAVFRGIVASIETLRPRATVISQYPSATLFTEETSSLNDHTKYVFMRLKEYFAQESMSQDRIQSQLNNFKNYNHHHIGYNLLNAANWLVIQEQN